MINFLVKRKPNSYNSNKGNKKIRYKETIKDALENYYSSYTPSSEKMYGVVYYFFKEDLDYDTDNISKPIWDSLVGELFDDDKQIVHRIASSCNLTEEDFSIIDISGLNGDKAVDLIDAIDNENHILYIECGNFNPSMLKFNLE